MKLFVLITSLITLSTVWAQQTTPAKMTRPQPNPPKATQPKVVNQTSPSSSPTANLTKQKTTQNETEFSFSYSPVYYTQAEAPATGDRAHRIEHEFIPKVKFSDYQIYSKIYYYQDLNDSSQSDGDLTQFIGSLRTPWDTSTYFKLNPDLIVYIPFLKKASDADPNSIIGAGLTGILKTADLGVPNLILKYGIFGFKINAKAEQDASGNYNVSERIRQKLYVGYNITDKILFMVYAHFDSNFLFNNEIRNKFLHIEFFEFAITDWMSFTIGHQNGGPLYKGSYQELNNLEVYNKEDSEFFAGFGFSF